MGVAITILLLALAGAIVGILVFNVAGVLLSIPLILLGAGFFITRDFVGRQRRMAQLRRFRRSARARQHVFDEEDRRTVV